MSKLNYVTAIINRLKALKTGIGGNDTAWTGQEDTPATTQTHIDALEAADAEIVALENQVSQKRTALKILTHSKSEVANAIELRAKGIHATATSKWIDYGLTDPNSAAATERTTRLVCKKGIIKSIIDDYDGVGFIVEWEKLADAETYEVERGIGVDAADVNIIPEFKHLVSIRKIKYTDDDVEKGKRYFYRIRGINAQGAGDWSNAGSMVQ
jgi:hypothetical protein